MELNMLVEEQLQSSLFDCFQDPITSIPSLDTNSYYLQSLAAHCTVNPECSLEEYNSLSPFPASLEQYYGDLSDYSLVPLPFSSHHHFDYSLVTLPDLSDQSPDPLLAEQCYYTPPPHFESLDSFLLLDTDGCDQQDVTPLSVAVPAERSGERRGTGRSKWEIGLEEIRGYFNVPITKAAKEMNVGLTVLKKRCRELGIPRWPHRKMKSLRTLINNVQELGKDKEDISKELEDLDEYRRKMEENPEIQFSDRTKKLRQACFKANYKKRRLMQDQSLDRNAVHQWMPYQLPSSSSYGYHVF